MRPLSFVVAPVLAALTACAPPIYDPREPEPWQSPPRATTPQVVHGELPPQRFEAPAQFDHARPSPVRVDERTLPQLSTRGRCVAAGAVPEPTPQRGAGTVAPRSSAPAGSSAKAAEPSTTAPPPAPAAGGSSAPPRAPAVGGSSAPQPEPAVEGTAPPESSMDEASASAPASKDDAAPSEDSRPRRSQRKAKGDSRREADAPPTQTAEQHEEQEQVVVVPPEPPPSAVGWGRSIFLSNDDSMSLSSAQRILFAIETGQKIPLEHIRKHEFLNYFSFATAPVGPTHDFSVLGQMAPSRLRPSTYTLALAVAGRPVRAMERRNVALTLVLDRSGSMRAEGRMEYLKQGLYRMMSELQPGDLLSLVTFDHRVCVPLQNFVVGRDDPRVLERVLRALQPAGKTNLHAGLRRGYELADVAYQPHYTNRVLLITDALSNVGETNPATLAMISDYYDARRIRLSGIGVGQEFNDALLNRLTEAGRGAYVFLGSEAEVETIFGRRFTSLVETIANDVHFRLQLPPTLRIVAFHGEEASTVKSDVQAVHFFADSRQLFLAELEAWEGKLRPQDGILLEIDYLDAETGAPTTESYAIGVDRMLESSVNVQKAEVVVRFIDGLETLATPPFPGAVPAPGACAQVRQELGELARGVLDPEVERMLRLWDRACGQAPVGRPPRKAY